MRTHGLRWVAIGVLLIAVLFSSCRLPLSRNNKSVMGFDPSAFSVVEERDTHGGFLGDGDYYLILDCSSNADEARKIIEDWKPLPLSENLQLIMYGGEKNGVQYGYDLAQNAQWPRIEHGCYQFADRHSESKNPDDDSELFDRYSFNFEIAIYDLDSDYLYYYRFDT